MNIVVQTVILLLSFDESGYNLIVVGNSGGLFNLIECVFNNFNVSQILFHKLSLFFISFSNSLESHLKNNNWIREFMALIGISWVWFNTLVLKFNDLIFFFKSNLKSDNLTFESIFFFLMLGLQSNDLIICFLGNFANCLIILILDFSFFLCFLDFLSYLVHSALELDTSFLSMSMSLLSTWFLVLVMFNLNCSLATFLWVP